MKVGSSNTSPPTRLRLPRWALVANALVWAGLFGFGVVQVLSGGPRGYTRQHPAALFIPLAMLAHLGANQCQERTPAHRVLSAAFYGLIFGAVLALWL
jgi:cytochrome b561